MKEYVAKLYVVVFKFLAVMMTKWSKSSINRLFRSFDRDCFKDEIEEKKTKIRDLERRLERQASLPVQRSIKEVPTQDPIAKIIATAQAKFDANFWQKAEQYQRSLGEAMVKTLQEQYLSALWTQREELDRQQRSPLPQMISRQPSPMSETSNDTKNALEQIQFDASRFVRQYSPQNHVAAWSSKPKISMSISKYLIASSDGMLRLFLRCYGYKAPSRSRCLLFIHC